jgi:glycosyltransferase involved in cell wall biosynthesis
MVRASLNTPVDVPLVLFAGRLAEQKGVADLLFAMDLLQQVMPEVRTWIAGDGPLRKDLEGRSANHRLDGKVQFLGHREDVPSLLMAADMLVLPSHYEGLPNIVLEAMLYGTPVVACAAPGTTELIEDGVTGLLTPPSKPSELTRAIRKYILDPELRKRLAAAAKEKIEKDFSAQAMVDRFVELYEGLARKKGLIK